MYLKRWRSLLFLFFVLAPGAAFPQSDSLRKERIALLISLPHLLLRGYHLDVEKPLPRLGRHSLLISSRIYSGNTRFADSFTSRKDEEEDFSRVKGFGAEIRHRIYLHSLLPSAPSSYYISYGFSYHHFNIDFEKEGWVQEMAEDGLLYYHFKYSGFKEKIDRWGAIALVGKQERYLSERLLIDGSIGFGYNHSISTSDHHVLRFNRNSLDYGYTGFYLILGLKAGVMLFR